MQMRVIIPAQKTLYIRVCPNFPIYCRIIVDIVAVDASLASTDADNAVVLAPHFERVYTADRPVTWEVIDDIAPQDTVEGIDHPIEWEEVKFAVGKLANGKSPGLNDVPPDAFKALSNQNLDLLHNFFNAYWRGEINFSEWHEGQVVPVPKSEDLSDQNK